MNQEDLLSCQFCSNVYEKAGKCGCSDSEISGLRAEVHALKNELVVRSVNYDYQRQRADMLEAKIKHDEENCARDREEMWETKEVYRTLSEQILVKLQGARLAVVEETAKDAIEYIRSRAKTGVEGYSIADRLESSLTPAPEKCLPAKPSPVEKSPVYKDVNTPPYPTKPEATAGEECKAGAWDVGTPCPICRPAEQNKENQK